MTTSGVTTWSLGTNALIAAAMRKLSVLGDGQSPSSTQYANGTEALNAMLKTFMAKGMPLWVNTEYALTPTSASTYTFGIGQTVNIPAPLKVLQVIRKDTTATTNVPMSLKTHIDFNLLPSSTTTGAPIQYWYEPLNQTGVLHIWPAPDAYTIANCNLTIVYQKPFQDMVGTTDTLDFPQWWHEAVIYGLADRLSTEFGIPIQDRTKFSQDAEHFLEEALSFGTEEGSMYIMPNWSGR